MLTRQEVLDELAILSTVEHALCVEYLFVACVLGHGRESAADDDDIDAQVDGAAGHALNGLAIGEMQLLRAINETLVRAGRRPRLGRATSVAGDPVAISFAPLTAAQLDGLLEREHAIAAAVDARYARLPTTVETLVDPATGEDPFANIGTLVAVGSGHAEAFAALQEHARRADGGAVFARAPGAVRWTIRSATCAPMPTTSTSASSHPCRRAFPELSGVGEAVGMMFDLGELHIRLVNRGLLPAFTLPPDYRRSAARTGDAGTFPSMR